MDKSGKRLTDQFFDFVTGINLNGGAYIGDQALSVYLVDDKIGVLDQAAVNLVRSHPSPRDVLMFAAFVHLPKPRNGNRVIKLYSMCTHRGRVAWKLSWLG